MTMFANIFIIMFFRTIRLAVLNLKNVYEAKQKCDISLKLYVILRSQNLRPPFSERPPTLIVHNRYQRRDQKFLKGMGDGVLIFLWNENLPKWRKFSSRGRLWLSKPPWLYCLTNQLLFDEFFPSYNMRHIRHMRLWASFLMLMIQIMTNW